jgi:hypothetical protein
MPILMVALLALAVFGVIGVMLAAAVILESKANLGQHPKDAGLRGAQR